MADTTSGTSTSQDSVQIKNLQLPFPIVAPDVWGNSKEQPALVSVRLVLHEGFSTASGADKLDDSTIHYGNLAKTIRASSQNVQSPEDVIGATEKAIHTLALKSEAKFTVAESVVELHLPKASMLGSEVVITAVTTWDRVGKPLGSRKVFELRDVVVPTLIGVNAYERAMKQPLVVTLALHWEPAAHDAQKATLAGIEQVLVEVIQETAYETLETLVEFTYTQLVHKMPQALHPGTRFRLRVEKPRAIAFADAPVIEIVRIVPKQGSSRPVVSDATLSSTLAGLSIVKPYSG